MATVVQSMIEPDAEAIKAHLCVLFEPCSEHYPQGLIELRYGQDKPNQSTYFASNENGIADAVSFAANRSREGCNVYVGVNPRKPTTRGSAEDTDVAVAFWQFADLDSVEAVDQAGRRMKALPPTMTVTTGTEPHRRPHLYWKLEEPVGNMPAWTERQRGIAQSFDGDAVINPSRIMRLAGTVNYPPRHKLERGYRMELTSLRTQFSDEREPVSPEQISTAYPMREKAGDPHLLQQDGQSTLQAMRRTQVQDLIDACLRGDAWHNHMIRLVAHLAYNGRTSAEILALADHITLPGYSVDQTRREMNTALEGARAKWALPEPEDSVEVSEAKREAETSLDVIDAFDFEESAIPVRPWIIPGVMLAGYTHMLVAPGGSGKSLFTLQLGITLATGAEWGGWAPRKRVRTLIVNVEDDIDEQRRRLSAARNVMKPDEALLPGMMHLIRNAESIVVAKSDPTRKAVVSTPIVETLKRYIIENEIGALIVDPFAETFEGDENSNSEVKWAMRIWRDEIARPTGCAVYLVHHTTKYANAGAGDANVVRGAGAIVNSTRISATLMPMTQDEAKLLGIDPEKRNRYVRYDDAKANQSLLSGKAHWFEKISVEIANGTGLTQADEVGALAPWTPPDAFNDISTHHIKIALERISRGMEGEDGAPTGERFSLHKAGSTGKRWAGNVLIECFGVEAPVATKMLKTWVENGVISELEYDDPVQRKKRNGVTVDMRAVNQMGFGA
ncbi:hypothetical protein HNO88_000294 [Novosphingobium chloroacetimidivorans]|uniref:AAA family ATPase n=1 Tax=Novosphingobium chloroacetimidivorans TaxID=1428314 RepID=A0A7W7K671_9SPHN|nr:AAA family ATPase [Novosphingobium chloroacetimidivorans]MBB4856997.1 hypothetical protein [Novosphingobium chloroacetimidivorans]